MIISCIDLFIDGCISRVYFLKTNENTDSTNKRKSPRFLNCRRVFIQSALSRDQRSSFPNFPSDAKRAPRRSTSTRFHEIVRSVEINMERDLKFKCRDGARGERSKGRINS